LSNSSHISSPESFFSVSVNHGKASEEVGARMGAILCTELLSRRYHVLAPAKFRCLVGIFPVNI
jgi:hypothetical protein